MQSLQQHINKIAEIFFRIGGDTAVICPGSRDVPLILAFTRHKKIKCIPITDERSAGFIALGVAQQTQKPVALICTSGTAILNFYPALCEAFYQQIPLVVITADRPPEFIDQWDGQAIRQNEVFKNHILKQITIPHSLDEGSMQAIEMEVCETLILGKQQKLPVHINVPLREPFYPALNENYDYDFSPLEAEPPSLLPLHYSALDEYEMKVTLRQIHEVGAAQKSLKLLVVIGMNHFTDDILVAVKKAQQSLHFPVIADVISNYISDDLLANYDFILDTNNKLPQLIPDILITMGGPVLSKNLKKFIRSNKPIMHLHIQAFGHVGNPFHSLSSILRVAPERFFEALSNEPLEVSKYFDAWKIEAVKMNTQKEIAKLPFCELKAAHIVFNSIPSQSNLQLANSMAVRYALLFDIDATIKVNSNRGTSGIDGCSSTAVGAAITTPKLTTLITGDIAFFYDVNAYWNTLKLPNLRIVILNNGGGGIFRLIEGPSALNELEEFIENAHSRTAEFIAKDFKLSYKKVTTEEELRTALPLFFQEDQRLKVLEIFTDKYENEKGYKSFKTSMSSHV